MSYEQKYLKYKQKYQELKKMLGGSAHQLETENYSDIADFALTDTPTNIEQSIKNTNFQQGGAEMEVEEDFNLTDTPTENQKGGSTLMPSPYTPTAPLPSCPGQVNPMPNVNVPLPSLSPMITQNKNLVGDNEEMNTTTDLSEIQNTEDIAKLFSQFGGKHKDDSSSSSSSSSSSDSDISDSDSF
jgi:hypothetical protein